MDVLEPFETDEKCWIYLESVRWPKGIRCPKCGGEEISKFLSFGSRRTSLRKKTAGVRVPARRLYQCKKPGCRHQFSATTGTLLAGSHLPLRIWFRAIAMVASGQDLSAAGMQRELGVSYRTAWFLAHRLREAMQRAQG